MKKNIITLIIIGIILIAAFIVFYYLFFQNNNELQNQLKGVTISTDKSEYSPGDSLKVKIDNQMDKKVCFSSCYPYYIQKKGEKWENYHYIECDKQDVVENCVNPGTAKSFELTLPKITNGIHRLSIFSCISCELTEKFKSNENFFSNRFFVK
jgi:hypothetical protein